MNANSSSIPDLLRGDKAALDHTLSETDNTKVLRQCSIAVAACGLYGATLGVWQGGMMPVYTAIKIPLVILITLLANGFLNGILSLLLGSGLGIRRTLIAQLTAFMVAAIILASLSPLTFFLARNLADPSEPGGQHAHAIFLLTHTLLIGFAGLTANAKLFDLLHHTAPTLNTARATYLAWLGGNLLAGAQITYILRPYFGTPGLPIQFIRDHPLEGNFLETVWFSFSRLLPGMDFAPRLSLFLLLLILGIALTLPKAVLRNPKPNQQRP